MYPHLPRQTLDPSLPPVDPPVGDPAPDPVPEPPPLPSVPPVVPEPSAGVSSAEPQPPVSDVPTPPVESSIPPESSIIPPPSSSEPPPSSSSIPEPSSTPSLTPSSTTESTTESQSTAQTTEETSQTEFTSTPSSSSASTTSFTTVVTSLNGRLTTYTSALPTNLFESNSRTPSDPRTGLIAGLTSGLIVLLLLLLGAAFAYRRHRHRRHTELLTAEKLRKEGRSLLDGEGFYDDAHHGAPTAFGSVRSGGHDRHANSELAMRSYTASENRLSPSLGSAHSPQQTFAQYQNYGVGNVNYQTRSISPTLSIIRSRASETGSIFREDVWPPPTDELVDPMTVGSSQVDLSRVVDDVMGPSPTTPGGASAAGAGAGYGHYRQGTDTSMESSSPLIQTVDRGGGGGTDPFQYHHQHPPPQQQQQQQQYQQKHGSYPSLTGMFSTSGSSDSSHGPLAPPPTLPTMMPTASVSLSPSRGHPPPPPPSSFHIKESPLPPLPPQSTSSHSHHSNSQGSASNSSSTSFLGGGGGGVLSASPTASASSWSLPPAKRPTSSTLPKRSSPLARKLSADARVWFGGGRGGGSGNGGGGHGKHSATS